MQWSDLLRRVQRRAAAGLIVCMVVAVAARSVGADGSAQSNKPPVDAGTGNKTKAKSANGAAIIPDPKQVGGEPEGVVQVANLIYAGVKSSHCFSDHFLIAAEKTSTISTSRRFHAVKLSSTELFDYPLVIMTGEGDFSLTDEERQNLRSYVERGGFLLASASCSSQEWNRAFRTEMSRIFKDHPLRVIPMDHPLFNTVTKITSLKARHGTPRPLEGVTLGGRLGVVYSQDGLNDTAHTQGCCCCGGNEIVNCVEVNVNILAYAVIY
jgi:hypothetical protein